MARESLDAHPLSSTHPPVPPPAPLPVTWQLSRWRRAEDLKLVLAFGVAGLWLRNVGLEVIGLIFLGLASLVLLTTAWFLLFPGQIRLDADGVSWNRRTVAWTRVASFRLNRSGGSAEASTYLSPTSAEEERLQRVGAAPPVAVGIPARVAGMPPWRVVVLLNHYREAALERQRLQPSSTDVPVVDATE